MRRRDFIKVIGSGAVTWPLVARAQQHEQMRRVGVLLPATADDAGFQARVGAFLQGLQQLGWRIGQNVQVDIRWATSDADVIRRHAAELAAQAPHVILAFGASTVGPMLQATHTVPIVFPATADPVGAGFVRSLARPGGNVTGFMSFEYGIGGKWLELLKEIAPKVTRVAVLRDPAIPSGIGIFGVVQTLAASLRMEVMQVNLRDAGEVERAVLEFAPAPTASLSRRAHWQMPIVTDLPNSQLSTNCPPSTTSARSPPPAGWFPMGPTLLTSSGARPSTSTASSRARSLPICRCRRRPNTS